MGSTYSPITLAQEKRSFSWPGSLPYHHLNLPTTTSPSFLTAFKSVAHAPNTQPRKRSPDMVPLRTTTITTKPSVTPLWVSTSLASAATASAAGQHPAMATTVSTALTHSPLGAQHIPVGTPLFYQLTSAQGFGLQSPLIGPLLTVLPTGVARHPPTSTVSPQQVFLNPNQGLSLLAQGQVPALSQQNAAKQAPASLPPNLFAVTSTTPGGVGPIAEPSTGQVLTSPLAESIQVSSGSQSPPRTLASIPSTEMTRGYVELKAFAEEFKTKRIRLGYTQGAVGQSLADKGYSNFAQSTISRFEQMQLSPTNAAAIKQVLEKWLQEAESPSSASSTSSSSPMMASRKRKRRAVFTPQTRTCMDEFFRQNPRPNRQLIESIAQQLDLLPEEVRVWFCNKRQKEKQHHSLQTVYSDRESVLSSGSASPTSLYDHAHLKRRSPSPKTSFTIEELSKSSASSTSSSPVHLTSPFAMSSMGAITTTSSQNVFPMLVAPHSSPLGSISQFLNAAPVITKA